VTDLLLKLLINSIKIFKIWTPGTDIFSYIIYNYVCIPGMEAKQD